MSISHQAALLLLADGRLPAGGYAHSGGLEPAVELRGVTNAASLESFLEGRAATVGFVAASFAAATCEAVLTRGTGQLPDLDEELDVRMPSPVARAVSRALGRQLARALSSIRPDPRLAELEGSLHQPIAFGVGAALFELSPRDAAGIALHDSVAGPAAAAVKVLRTDPFTVHRALARLTGFLDDLADEAAEHGGAVPEDLPALGSPLLDIAAEHHRSQDVRLFAS